MDDKRQVDATQTYKAMMKKMTRFDVPEEASRSTATSADGILDEGRAGRTRVSIATAVETDDDLNIDSG